MQIVYSTIICGLTRLQAYLDSGFKGGRFVELRALEMIYRSVAGILADVAESNNSGWGQ